MMSPTLPSGLIDRLGWSGLVESADRIPPGFSGAAVWHVKLSGLGEHALKRLPSGADAARIKQTHCFVQAMREAGAVGLPSFFRWEQAGTLVRFGDHLWEASSWQPGQPLAVDADIDEIAAGAAAIGRLHRVAMDAGLGHRRQIAPGVVDRIQRLSSIDLTIARSSESLAQRNTQIAPESRTTIDRAANLLKQGWPIVGPGIMDRLMHRANRPIDCHCVLRDVHRDHVLFGNDDWGNDQIQDDKIRFIDFDAMRIDTPALDLARWVGSFSAGDRDGLWDRSMAEYRRECSIPDVLEDDWAGLVNLLHESGTWGSLANWVKWVCQDGRFDVSNPQVESRIRWIADAAARTIV